MKGLIDQNPWWNNKEYIEKDYDILKWKEKKYRWIPDVIKKINVKPFALHIILGARQVGKTTLLKLLIKELLDNMDPRSIFYFNCENLADNKELLEILNNYLEFKESNNIDKAVILLDEVTSPSEWYKAVKFLIDTGKLRNDVIIITGSSSISVKREVELFPGRRGKGDDFILYPLSFRGFLNVINPEILKKIKPLDNFENIGRIVINALVYEKELNKYLEKYMEYGGFPFSMANIDKDKEEAKRIYLSWVKNAILKAERSDVIARQIIGVVLETLQTDISWGGISKKIEIKSPKTVAAYLDLLKSAFIINILYNIDLNGKKIKFGKNKKIHIRDPLLLELFEDWAMVNVRDKKSALAESLVIEHLTRKFPERVFFWKNKYEIDAIVLEKNNLYGFEVKWREKTDVVKKLSQIKELVIITKKDYSREPLKIPLSIFLSLFDV